MTSPAVIFIVLGLVTQPKIDHILIRIAITAGCMDEKGRATMPTILLLA